MKYDWYACKTEPEQVKKPQVNFGSDAQHPLTCAPSVHFLFPNFSGLIEVLKSLWSY